jgi:TfoX/Sxy family transcriptional regulator of competence genes
MPSDKEIAAAILARLAPLPVAVRSLFGLMGLYLDGQYFGFVSNGAVYFRTDDESKRAYVERGMGVFQPKNRPRGPKTVDYNFTLPKDVEEDDELLKEWALRAAQAASQRVG